MVRCDDSIWRKSSHLENDGEQTGRIQPKSNVDGLVRSWPKGNKIEGQKRYGKEMLLLPDEGVGPRVSGPTNNKDLVFTPISLLDR